MEKAVGVHSRANQAKLSKLHPMRGKILLLRTDNLHRRFVAWDRSEISAALCFAKRSLYIFLGAKIPEDSRLIDVGILDELNEP